jgi:hypothetical protein
MAKRFEAELAPPRFVTVVSISHHDGLSGPIRSSTAIQRRTLVVMQRAGRRDEGRRGRGER